MLSQIVVNSIVSGAIYALLAFGFTITYGTLNFFNMAHGVAFTVGAYLCYVFRIVLGLDLQWAVSFAVIGTAFTMIAVDLVAYERLRARHAPSWAMVVSSLGVAILLEASLSLLFGTDTLTLRTGATTPGFAILGAIITPTQIVIVMVSTVLVALLTLYLQMTRRGKALRAMADDPELSVVIGVRPRSTYMSTFALASGLAAVAGCLVALETDLYPTMGHSALLKSIVASIVGGIGNVPGAVFGGLFLGFAENFGVWKLSSGWQDGIALALLLIFLLLRKSGGFLARKAS